MEYTTTIRVPMFLAALFLSTFLVAQTPGLIYLPPGGMGVTPMNPDGNGMSSIAATGYDTNDIVESEIPYVPIPVPYAEPTSDLARGADCSFSDIVRLDAYDSGVYMYSDGTNLLFRFRQSKTIPGAKGYSILIDSDMRFGCCGADADPNYIPKTTGTNGNPGFEIEIVLETNFQVAAYDVDGTDNPTVPVFTYPVNTHHQRSVALTNNCGDPDYFHDFYIVLADLYTTFGINASTPLRYAATTVMAPTPAIGGPLSDINGGGGYSDLINYQCGTPIGTTATTQPPCSCTNPPTINGPIPSGTNVPISGNWNNAGPLTPSSADIEVFLNGTSQGTTTTTDGAGWSMTLAGPLVNGDTIYATALAVGEGLCDPDPQIIIVSDCTPANTSATPVISCVGPKGIKGTSTPGATIVISLFNAPPTSIDSFLVSIVSDPVTGEWGWDGNPLSTNNTASNICTAGSGDMPEGTIKVSATDPGSNCPSPLASECSDRSGGSYPLSGQATPPVITTDPIEEGTSDISGTATADDIIRLYINGFLIETTTATGGTFTFVSVSPLYQSDNISITAQSNLTCESLPTTSVVSCVLDVPSIDANELGQVADGDVLTGTSTEEGSTINIYDASAPTVVLGTATVSGGVWTSSVTVTAGTTYYATVLSACGESGASLDVTGVNQTPNRCGAFTNTPLTMSSTSIDGNLLTAVANTTVNVYLDGYLIGSVVTSTDVWSLPISGTDLYTDGVLTFGVQEPGLMEFLCPAQTTVECTSDIPLFSYTPTGYSIIGPNDTGVRTFDVSGTVAGVCYVLEEVNAPNEDWAVSVFSTGADFTFTTFPFTQAGIYNLRIRAMDFTGASCDLEGLLSVTRDIDLPIELAYFNVNKENRNQAVLNWRTLSEINSSGFDILHAHASVNQHMVFESIGFVPSTGGEKEATDYQFLVEDLEPGFHYFRLNHRDIDGTSSMSPIRSVEVIGSGRPYQIYPTTFEASLVDLIVSIPETGRYQVKVVSVDGKELISKTIQIDKYTNRISLDFSTFKTGMYYLNISNQASRYNEKIVIQK